MDNRKTVFRFILSALLIFMVLSFIFAFYNSQISNFNRSLLALSGDIEIKKIQYNPEEAQLAKDKKRMDMTKRMSIPVTKKPAAGAAKTTASTASTASTSSRVTGDRKAAKNGFYIENPAKQDKNLFMQILTKDQAVYNIESWNGVQDASASCILLKDSKGITATVSVIDDKLIADSQTSYQNDCVELYFDFRPPATRGKEVFEKGVIQVIAVPCFGKLIPDTAHFYNGNSGVNVTVPGTKVRSEIIQGKGYIIKVFLPLEGLKSIGINPDREFNFDFGVIDVDENKKTQIMWSGTADNCNNPKWYGHLKPAE